MANPQLRQKQTRAQSQEVLKLPAQNSSQTKGKKAEEKKNNSSSDKLLLSERNTKILKKKAKERITASDVQNSLMKQEELKQKTEKLIKKLKLKPERNESQYSQSFIDRERSVIRRIQQISQEKISKNSKAGFLEKNQEFNFFQKDFLQRRLGLKKKDTIE